MLRYSFISVLSTPTRPSSRVGLSAQSSRSAPIDRVDSRFSIVFPYYRLRLLDRSSRFESILNLGNGPYEQGIVPTEEMANCARSVNGCRTRSVSRIRSVSPCLASVGDSVGESCSWRPRSVKSSGSVSARPRCSCAESRVRIQAHTGKIHSITYCSSYYILFIL